MITTARAIVQTSVRKAMPQQTAPAAEEPATGTALAQVAPVEPSESARFSSQRPAATFLAQLIAIRQSAPQTRPRNRAEPREAVAAYDRVIRMVNRAA